VFRPRTQVVPRLCVRYCSVSSETLRVVGVGGDYHISVPYPGGRSVWFPVTDTDKVRALKVSMTVEDPTIKNVGFYTKNGVKVAAATSVADLLQDDFVIRLNDKSYTVLSPKHTKGTNATVATPSHPKFQEIRNFLKGKAETDETLSLEEFLQKCEDLGIDNDQANVILAVLSDLGDVLHVKKNIELHDVIFLRPSGVISCLETALDINRIKLSYQERLDLLQSYKDALAPLEASAHKHYETAERSASRIAYGVLFGLSFQFFLFARFTWWDYDWDVMEPVTYFTTIVETAIAGYGWYLWTGSEYQHMNFRELLLQLRLKREYRKHNFDKAKYVDLRDKIVELETEVKHLTHE